MRQKRLSPLLNLHLMKGYHKVFARSFSTNPASDKVLQKIGMQKEGTLIDHVRKEDQYQDLVYYGIINQ